MPHQSYLELPNFLILYLIMKYGQEFKPTLSMVGAWGIQVEFRCGWVS